MKLQGLSAIAYLQRQPNRSLYFAPGGDPFAVELDGAHLLQISLRSGRSHRVGIKWVIEHELDTELCHPEDTRWHTY